MLVVRDAMAAAVSGLAAGVLAAVPAGRLLSTLLYGVGGFDAATVAAGAAGVCAISAAGAWAAARSFGRLDASRARPRGWATILAWFFAKERWHGAQEGVRLSAGAPGYLPRVPARRDRSPHVPGPDRQVRGGRPDRGGDPREPCAELRVGAAGAERRRPHQDVVR